MTSLATDTQTRYEEHIGLGVWTSSALDERDAGAVVEVVNVGSVVLVVRVSNEDHNGVVVVEVSRVVALNSVVQEGRILCNQADMPAAPKEELSSKDLADSVPVTVSRDANPGNAKTIA